ncbi:MAG: hypothetical protein ACKVQU_05320 [Burkholderiales bacterium]
MRTGQVYRTLLFVAASGLTWGQAWSADKPDSGDILKRGTADLAWSDLYSDKAAAAVSATSMLGLKPDAIPVVENVRDIVVALKGASTGDKGQAFGLSITPARTSLTPMNLSTYASSNPFWRIVGSTNLSYAQGTAKIQGAEFDQWAVAIQTSFFFYPEDDPVLALAIAHTSNECKVFPDAKPPSLPPGSLKPDPGPETPGSVTPKPASADEIDRVGKNSDACRKVVADRLSIRWNRSQMALSLGTGRIKPSNGSGDEVSLGSAAVVSTTWGIGKSWALSGALRHTKGEPIAASLLTTSPRTKSTNTGFLRVAGGSDHLRAVAQVSSVKNRELTTSEREFRHAVGLDFRLYSDLWINFRVGRQYKIVGDGMETAGLLTVSYSPTSLLK